MAEYKIKGMVKVGIGTSANLAEVQIKPATGYLLDHEGKKYGVLVDVSLTTLTSPVNPSVGRFMESKDGFLSQSFSVTQPELISPLTAAAVTNTVLMISVEETPSPPPSSTKKKSKPLTSPPKWTLVSLEIPG